MLKYCTFIVAIILSHIGNSQNSIIKIQNFDEPNDLWQYTSNVSFFNNNNDGFFGIHNGDQDNDIDDTGYSIKAESITSTFIMNDFIFINDLNDEGDNGTNSEAVITFDEIDIRNYRNVIISFDFEIFGFESSDYIRYEVIENNISTSVDLPKIGLDSVSYLVNNSTQTLGLKIIVKQNGADDFAGIDNIKLMGQLINPCKELIISEYIEGNSSTNYRNNYIEIYNPNNLPVDLSDYDLVKYTGANLGVSGTLEFEDIIPAHGTYTIEDITETLNISADLSTNSSVMDFNGDDKIALRYSGEIIDLIGLIGDDSNFAKDLSMRRKSAIQNPNNQFNIDEWDIYGLEALSNLNAHISYCSGPIPEIEVIGINLSINDESEITTEFNNTYFGSVDTGNTQPVIKDFFIKNIGIADLTVDLSIIGSNANDFSLLKEPDATIQPNDSSKVQIQFLPNTLGVKTAIVSISNNDASENPFNFWIQGEGTGVSNSSLMITQYYEGSANNKWLEITNISASKTPENTYFIGLYWNDDAKNPLDIKPSRSVSVPELNPGQSIKYRSTLEVLEPQYAIDGNEIKSSICSFTGDDIIIISTSNDINSWKNRLDIIGNSKDWGSNISFIRKYGCEGVSTNTGYQYDQWFAFEIAEINNAIPNTNNRIGEHYIDNTTFINTETWTNGIPDQYRSAIIDFNYQSTIHGDLIVCNLTINQGVKFDIEADNFLMVSNNLSVEGVLNVAHEGSIIMINDDGNISRTGEINIHKKTTPLKKYDYTYWSSPIQNATLENVFKDTPQNSFYQFTTQNFADHDNDNIDDDNNTWQRAQGKMLIGKGYTAMAPNEVSAGNSQSIIFSGTINNGVHHIPIQMSSDNSNEFDDWNLIGNPYPSAIDANLFLNHATNKEILNGSLYFWTHHTEAESDEGEKKYSSDDYSIYNVGTGGVAANSEGIIPTGKIASGQGFFAEAIQEGDIIFNNEMRLKLENNNFFKPDKVKNSNDKIWINLYNEEGVFSQILIGFIDGATNDFESDFDAHRFQSIDKTSFYSIVKDQYLAIQGREVFKGDEEISLGITSSIEENIDYEIGLKKVEGNIQTHEIFIYDKLQNIIHDLKSGSYKFKLNKQGEINDRFLLKFINSTLVDENIIGTKEKIICIQNESYFSIRTNRKTFISTIDIYDLLGRRLKEINVNQDEAILKSSVFNKPGIYLLQIHLKSSKSIVHKLIKG